MNSQTASRHSHACLRHNQIRGNKRWKHNNEDNNPCSEPTPKGDITNQLSTVGYQDANTKLCPTPIVVIDGSTSRIGIQSIWKHAMETRGWRYPPGTRHRNTQATKQHFWIPMIAGSTASRSIIIYSNQLLFIWPTQFESVVLVNDTSNVFPQWITSVWFDRFSN